MMLTRFSAVVAVSSNDLVDLCSNYALPVDGHPRHSLHTGGNLEADINRHPATRITIVTSGLTLNRYVYSINNKTHTQIKSCSVLDIYIIFPL